MTAASGPGSPELRRSLRLPHATAMVVGTIIGASIFVQPSEMTGAVPSIAGLLAGWIGGGPADPRRRADLRRAGVGVPADRRRLRLPERDAVARRRLPLGLGDVLEHALRHHRGDRRHLRPLRRATSCRCPPAGCASRPSPPSWRCRPSTTSASATAAGCRRSFTVGKLLGDRADHPARVRRWARHLPHFVGGSTAARPRCASSRAPSPRACSPSAAGTW